MKKKNEERKIAIYCVADVVGAVVLQHSCHEVSPNELLIALNGFQHVSVFAIVLRALTKTASHVFYSSRLLFVDPTAATTTSKLSS